MKRNIETKGFIDEHYSLDKFKVVYRGIIEPMSYKSKWPKIDLGYILVHD